MRYTQIRDGIFAALNSVYRPDDVNNWYNYGYGSNTTLNQQLTTEIMAIYIECRLNDDESNDSYYKNSIFRRITNHIWTNYAGGGTAEIAARKVCAVLNVPVED